MCNILDGSKPSQMQTNQMDVLDGTSLIVFIAKEGHDEGLRHKVAFYDG